MEEQTVSEQRRSAVKNLLECGYTYQQVADEMGFKSKNSVTYYAKGKKISRTPLTMDWISALLRMRMWNEVQRI